MFKLAAFGALWTVLLCGVAMLVIVGMFWWQAWHAPISAPVLSQQPVDAQQKALEKTLDAYKTQADDLQRLVSLLIGLSSFYALVLGISSYLTAQHFIDRSKEGAQQVDRYREEMEKAYPAFINFGSSINEGIESLMSLLPSRYERDEFWAKLSEKDKQLILFLERSMAFIEHLNWKEKRIAVMYQGLGKFYSAWYSDEKEKADKKKATERKGSSEPAEPEAYGTISTPIENLAVRAFFYLERAIDRDPRNFAARNDFALACDDMAGLPAEKSGRQPDEFQQKAQSNWEESLRLEQRQQRARYNLASVLKGQGKVTEAVAYLTEALKYRNWQTEPNPLRTKDVHYNLACYPKQIRGSTGAGAKGLGGTPESCR